MNKILKKINIEGFKEIGEEINKNIKNGTELRKTIEKIKEKDRKEKKYGHVELFYCPNCNEGYLILKFFEVNSKGRASEISERTQQISINQGVTIELARK